jgi:hypothetical protein
MKEEEIKIEESQCAWDQIKEKWEKKKMKVRVGASFLVFCF